LEWIQILPAKRGLGLGQSLVNELLQRLNSKDAQLIMAKVTGHFKHGNEKINKRKKN